MRRTECAALRWDEVDFVGKVIRVPGKKTKTGTPLDLPMSSFIHDLLVRRRAIGNADGWVFPSHHGHIQDPSPYFQEIAKVSGIHVTAHDLRRTFITIAEGCDISPLALKALVNHTLGGDVTEGYVRMTTGRLREPVERVCRRLMELYEITTPVGENILRIG
jgi:integrase